MKVSLSLLSFSPRMALRRIYCRSSAKRIPKRKRNSSKNSFLSWNVETRRSKDLLCWDTNKVRFIYVINYSESRFIIFFCSWFAFILWKSIASGRIRWLYEQKSLEKYLWRLGWKPTKYFRCNLYQKALRKVRSFQKCLFLNSDQTFLFLGFSYLMKGIRKDKKRNTSSDENPKVEVKR